MNSYVKNVKRYLLGKKIDIQDILDEIRTLEDDKKNRDQSYINTLNSKIKSLKMRIGDMKNGIMSDVATMGNNRKQELIQMTRLKGEDLTDDYKLFNCGIKLSPEEVDAIIDRNAGNDTMIQLALRYANKNGIKSNRVYYGKALEMKETDQVYEAVRMYVDHWIDNEKAGEMLDKFFPEVE